MRKILILIISLIMISCSNASIYRVSITQGTVFKQEDINKLELGMTKDQVTYVIGQPSFENFFEKNVWNYFFQIKTGDSIELERRLKLVFDDKNLLSEIDVIKI